MSVYWQLVDDARSNLNTGRIANDVLIGLLLFGNEKYKNPPIDPRQNIVAGRDLLVGMRNAATGKNRRSIPVDAYSALYAFSSSSAGADIVSELDKAISELRKILSGKPADTEAASGVFEKIVSASGARAEADLLKISGA